MVAIGTTAFVGLVTYLTKRKNRQREMELQKDIQDNEHQTIGNVVIINVLVGAALVSCLLIAFLFQKYLSVFKSTAKQTIKTKRDDDGMTFWTKFKKYFCGLPACDVLDWEEEDFPPAHFQTCACM